MRGLLPFARLVGDDRVHLLAAGGRLLVRPATALAGLIEMRGVGIVRMAYEPCAVVGIVVDLGVSAERLPQAEQRHAVIEGITLPRLAVAAARTPCRRSSLSSLVRRRQLACPMIPF